MRRSSPRSSGRTSPTSISPQTERPGQSTEALEQAIVALDSIADRIEAALREMLDGAVT